MFVNINETQKVHKNGVMTMGIKTDQFLIVTITRWSHLMLALHAMMIISHQLLGIQPYHSLEVATQVN